MKDYRIPSILGFVLLLLTGATVWRAQRPRVNFDAGKLTQDFVRVVNTQSSWRASPSSRLLHYVRNFRKQYDLQFPEDAGSFALLDIASSYSQLAGRPVYVRRDLAEYQFQGFAITSYTYGGILRSLNYRLGTNGVYALLSTDGSYIVMAPAEVR
jgi:hypothetical protein